ncbi:MAG: winged helix-turn-helix domain-containing protein [Firmicutes bacterium]|nr:winged helix-turn-helix domain-containing protein [Bacillota bacterium]
MASRYKFSSEEIVEIQKARKENTNKRVDRRLKALELRAQGQSVKEVGRACEYHPSYITTLVAKYRDGGLAAITENHYPGNRRNMSVEKEAAILEPFRKRAEAGMLVEISEIKAAYQKEVDHAISSAQIYYVLHRHGWRKIMPRSRHPKKASEEVIETSKKLTKKSSG